MKNVAEKILSLFNIVEEDIEDGYGYIECTRFLKAYEKNGYNDGITTTPIMKAAINAINHRLVNEIEAKLWVKQGAGGYVGQAGMFADTDLLELENLCLLKKLLTHLSLSSDDWERLRILSHRHQITEADEYQDENEDSSTPSQ